MNEKNWITISPFIGMATIKMTSIMLVVFVVLGLVTSGLLRWVFWIFVIIIAYLDIGQLYGRLSSPWRRVHFSLMHVYSYFAGVEKAMAEKEGRDFDVSSVLSRVLKNTVGGLTVTEFDHIIDSVVDKNTKFVDRLALFEFIRTLNPDAEIKAINKSLDDFEARILLPENMKSYIITLMIAELVEIKYGIDERTRYIYSVLIGEAF